MILVAILIGAFAVAIFLVRIFRPEWLERSGHGGDSGGYVGGDSFHSHHDSGVSGDSGGGADGGGT